MAKKNRTEIAPNVAQADPEVIKAKLKKLQELRKRVLEKGGGLSQREIDLRGECEESLSAFIRHAWKYIDPAPYVHGWHVDAISEHLEAQARCEIKHLLINQPPRTMKSISVSVCYAPWAWAQLKSGPRMGPSVSYLYASYAQTLSLRDSLKARRLIESPFYQRLWGERFLLTGDQNTKTRFENNKGGYRLATSVGGALTGEGASVCAVDDAHNSIEAESELVRKGVIEWWDSAMSTRLNNPRTGAYLVTMQRLNEEDLAGHIISQMSSDWTHLCLPMEFESDRKCFTGIGFEDPRTEEGELLWPERIGPDEVETLKRALGPFGCTPKESPVLMSDLSLKPISEVKIGDEVVGFESETEGGTRRRKLLKSNVLSVGSFVADIVKIKLSSGKEIRCTPCHKWYIGKQAKRRQGKYPDDPIYRPAVIGRRLMRVCHPELPKLTDEESRIAGWLGGFFDGEGSITKGPKNVDGRTYKSSCQIKFYQTAEKNLPLCKKLEESLSYFGFEYHVASRKPPNNPHWQIRNDYTLTNRGRSSLELFQRFLHIVQPIKWRQRLIDGAYTANFIIEEETVLSITPDGTEEVFYLETSTGNYVVWGLASSNSAGQLQQRPEPKGGGIIKSEWWQPYDEKEFPAFEYIVAGLDTAYTEKQENDYSAMSVWGVYRNKENMPKIMAMYAWQKRLELHKLVEEVQRTSTRFRIDRLLIEDKAAGHSVAQELRRLFGGNQYAIQLVNPKAQDKVARTYSVQHIFAEKIVHAPARSWADDLLIPQMAQFPKGKHDDLHDSAIMAIRFLRDSGWALRKEENDAIIANEFAPKARQEALYDV